MTIYSRFVRNFNPAQRDTGKMLRIAVGPGGGESRWTDWTETVMKAWQGHQWSWDMEGLSLHNYTVIKWPPAYASVGFGEKEYAEILQKTLETDGLIAKHSAIMDKYDPQKKIALVVDEWGAWYAKLPGSPEGFLAQQNSQRDAVLAALNLNIFARHADRVRMANIAQMVNVLQAMILTDKEKMVLTPTYHVFQMYVPFQDATSVPVTFDAGTYTQGGVTLPRVDAIAAKDAAGKVWMAVTNVDPNRPRDDHGERGRPHAPVGGGPDPHRAPRRQRQHVQAPTTVAPKPIAAQVQGGTVTLDRRAQVGDGDRAAAIKRAIPRSDHPARRACRSATSMTPATIKETSGTNRKSPPASRAAMAAVRQEPGSSAPVPGGARPGAVPHASRSSGARFMAGPDATSWHASSSTSRPAAASTRP